MQRYNQWSTNVTEYRRNVHEDTLGNNTKAPSNNYDQETGSWLSSEPPQDRYSPAMQSRERSYYPKYACADTNYTLSDFEHDLDSFCADLGSELVKLLYGYVGEVYIFSAEVTNLYPWSRPIDIAELNRIHQEKAEWIAKRIIEMDMKGEVPSEGALIYVAGSGGFLHAGNEFKENIE